MKRLNIVQARGLIFVSALLLLSACGGGSSFSEEVDAAAVGLSTEPVTELSAVEIEGLLFMREEEELARDLYLDIYAETGNRLTVFKNISDNAETKHAEAVRLLLVKYGLNDPSTGAHDTYTDLNLQSLYDLLFNSTMGGDDLTALKVGALVEETDISDINDYIAQVSESHPDIIATYENLLCGSRNHLRSFASQIEALTGQAYVTQVPALDVEVRAILSSDQEQCGQ